MAPRIKPIKSTKSKDKSNQLPVKMDKNPRRSSLKRSYHFTELDILEKCNLTLKENVKCGYSSELYVAKHNTKPQTDISLKVFPLSHIGVKRKCRRMNTFIKESSIRKELEHDNIGVYINSFMCPKYAAILSSFCPDGTLFENLTKLTTLQVERYFTQMTDAISYMHAKRIVHRDINHHNIMISMNNAILTDFGNSKRLDEGTDMVTGFVGAPEYMSPEVYYNFAIPTPYDAFKADAFGLGVLLWCMIMKEDREEGDMAMARFVEPKRKEFPIIIDFCIQLIERDPIARKSVTVILKDLESLEKETKQKEM